MTPSRPDCEAPRIAPRVGLSHDEHGLVEVELPLDVTDEAWRIAATEAAGVARLTQRPARVLVDAACSLRFDRIVLSSRIRTWLDTLGANAGGVALVLPRVAQRVQMRLSLLTQSGGTRARVFPDRARAVRWLRKVT